MPSVKNPRGVLLNFSRCQFRFRPWWAMLTPVLPKCPISMPTRQANEEENFPCTWSIVERICRETARQFRTYQGHHPIIGASIPGVAQGGASSWGKALSDLMSSTPVQFYLQQPQSCNSLGNMTGPLLHPLSILLGIHLKGWAVWFYRYKIRTPKKNPTVQNRGLQGSVCVKFYVKKKVYILHWVGWVSYRIKSPKLKRQKFKSN